MKIPFVALNREAKLIKRELLSITEEVLDSGNYILGNYLNSFENSFANYVGSKYALGVGNGSDAITLILKSLKIKSGDEVICPANSFIASAWAIVAAGAKPVFCDVDDDLLISLQNIKKVISKRTKAVIIVHLTGRTCDLEEINEFCMNSGIHVIEDAAQAIGARSATGNVGNLGIAAGFSLHPLKNLSVYGDGGVLTTNNKDIYETSKLLRNHGLKNRDNCEIWGLNTRLDELQAAYALIKLKYIEEWTKKHIAIANKYSLGINDNIGKPTLRQNFRDVYHNYIITINPLKRSKFIEALLNLGVETKIHYPIPIHLQECSKELSYKKGSIPNCEKLCNSIVSLPIYHTLTENETDYVISSVNNVFEKL